MKRLDFKPFTTDDRQRLLLPVVVSSNQCTKRYLLPVVDNVTKRHLGSTDNVSESDVINTVNLLFFPARFQFSDLPVRQQNAILDSILNCDLNKQFLKAIL